MTSGEDAAPQIRAYLQQISGMSVSGYVRTDALGWQLDFSGWESSFDDLKRMTTQLSNSGWSRLPQGTQTTALDTLLEIIESLRAIRRFSADEGRERRDELAETFGKRLDAFKEIALTYGGYLLWEGSSGEERILPVLQEAEQRLQSIRKGEEEIETKKEEVDSILQTVRETAAEKGVTQEAETFDRASKRYETRSLLWLVGSALLLAATLGLAYLLVEVWETKGEITNAAILQTVLAKTAALAVLSYATITAVRLYRSNAHLAVVNRHRADALLTFKTFVDGSSDLEVRDKVLLVAANAAFGQTPTGLIGDKGDGGNTLEVLDGVAGGLIRRS